jgi:hypothetical protein
MFIYKMIYTPKGGLMLVGAGMIRRHRRDRGSALSRKSDLSTLKTMLANVSLSTAPKPMMKRPKKKICF